MCLAMCVESKNPALYYMRAFLVSRNFPCSPWGRLSQISQRFPGRMVSPLVPLALGIPRRDKPGPRQAGLPGGVLPTTTQPG